MSRGTQLAILILHGLLALLLIGATDRNICAYLVACISGAGIAAWPRCAP